jgi:hypothetical protein
MNDPDPLVSYMAFKWFITILTASLAGTWFFYDAYKIYKLRHSDGKDPTVHDKRFGYACGMVIGFIGVFGCLKFHGVV